MKNLSKETIDFIDGLVANKLACKWAMPTLETERDAGKLFYVASEPSNMDFLFHLIKKGVNVPLQSLKEDFKAFYNGGVIYHYGTAGTTYYAVGQTSELKIMNTVTTFFDCHCDVVCDVVNRFRIVVDESSSLRILVKPNTNITIETFGNPQIEIVGTPGVIKYARR